MSKKKETVQTSEEQMVVEKYEEVFQLVKNNGRVLIAVANTYISQKSFANFDEAKLYIDTKPWELIINVPCLLMEKYNNSKK